MKRILAVAAILLLSGCGGDHPVPEHGRVTDAKYTPMWTQIICTGKPIICYPIVHQEEWRLEITDLNNPEWVGTVAVQHDVYDRCNLQELWTECADENSGDTR